MAHDDRLPAWALWLLVLFGAIQPVAWLLVGSSPNRVVFIVSLLAAWINLALLAVVASRQIGGLRHRLSQREHAHQATLNEVDQLQLQNEMLQIVAQSADVPQAFQALAPRLLRMLPCDRIGLALLAEDRREFQTYTAGNEAAERRSRPLPEVVFKTEGTLLKRVIDSGRPLAVGDVRDEAGDCLDANVIATAGYQSALLVPLVAQDHCVGSLNFFCRNRNGLPAERAINVQAISEILAVAWVAQQLQVSLARSRTTEAMTELMLSIAAEINSALQAILGHCDLIMRESEDERLQRDFNTIMQQAERIASLLQRMREAAQERLASATHTSRSDDAGDQPFQSA